MKPNPFDDQVHFDSCAFDGGDESEQRAAVEVRTICKTNRERFLIAHSVVGEIENEPTPEWIKDVAQSTFRTVAIPLTSEEEETLKDIEKLIAGNGSVEKRKADCMHVFEAQKYGRYFVTTDHDIWKHAEPIRQKYDLHIVKPTELLEIVKYYAAKT